MLIKTRTLKTLGWVLKFKVSKTNVKPSSVQMSNFILFFGKLRPTVCFSCYFSFRGADRGEGLYKCWGGGSLIRCQTSIRCKTGYIMGIYNPWSQKLERPSPNFDGPKKNIKKIKVKKLILKKKNPKIRKTQP